MAKFYEQKNVTRQIIKLIMSRTITVLFLLLSCMGLALAQVLRPWKTEKKLGDPWTLEISPWSVCSHIFYRAKCYNKEYNEMAESWIHAWRSAMLISMVLLFFMFLYLCLELARQKDSKKKPWLYTALVCFIAALFNLTSLSIFYGYRKFEFLDPIRMHNMGWTSVIRQQKTWIETFRFPLVYCWCSEILMLITIPLCMYTRFIEDTFIRTMVR